MSINDLAQDYNNPVKQAWRKKLHAMLTPDISIQLVDSNGKYQYKIVDLVAKEAKTFDYILSTGKITEDKLIGINNDISIIDSCVDKFPKATFIHSEWDNFCLSNQTDDIGVVIFDSCNAAYGDAFNKSIRMSLKLVTKALSTIGECLLVINVDGNKTYRGLACNRTERVNNLQKMKLTFCENLNQIFREHNNNTINSMHMYPNDIDTYKQKANSANMLSCFILFR